MNQNKIIYWVTTGIVCAMMLVSGVMYLFSEQAKEGFVHIGFPNFFRVELGVAKIIGAIVLILPTISKNVKEWAYAGFGIVFISAIIAHSSIGDGIKGFGMPLLFLILLIVSYLKKGAIAKKLY